MSYIDVSCTRVCEKYNFMRNIKSSYLVSVLTILNRINSTFFESQKIQTKLA